MGGGGGGGGGKGAMGEPLGGDGGGKASYCAAMIPDDDGGFDVATGTAVRGCVPVENAGIPSLLRVWEAGAGAPSASHVGCPRSTTGGGVWRPAPSAATGVGFAGAAAGRQRMS